MKRLPFVALLSAVAMAVAVPATASAASSTIKPTSAGRSTTQSHGFGLLPPTHAVNRPAQRPRLAAAPVPAAVDLTPWTVPVGDQGQVNSCVTWSIDYAMLGWYSRREGHAGAPFAPMYAYSQIQASHGWSDGGAYVQDGLQIAEQQGIDTQTDYPQGNYNWWTLPTPAQHVAAAANRTLGSAFLYQSWAQPPGDGARSAIEQSVAAGHPVALSIPVYPAFETLSPTSPPLSAADVASSSLLGYHEVLIVGYDASGVRIQNSWGTSWGDHGFADLAWDFVDGYSTDASVMTGFADVATPAPAIASVTPASGPLAGGTTVTIHGLGLATVDAVTFGTAPAASFTVVDDTTVVATAPPAAAEGAVQLQVSGPTGTGTAATPFTYVSPQVTSLLPPVGATRGGTSLTLTGSALRQVTGATVGGLPVTSLQVLDDSTLRIVTPAHVAGTVDVALQVGADSIPAGSFRYVAGPDVRWVTRPSSRVIVLHGSGLLAATTVIFGRHPARIIARTDRTIRVLVPLHAGAHRVRVQVRVATPYGTAVITPRARFRY